MNANPATVAADTPPTPPVAEAAPVTRPRKPAAKPASKAKPAAPTEAKPEVAAKPKPAAETKPAAKAKPAAKPAAKAATSAPAKKPATKVAKAPAPAKAEKPAKPKKAKLVRDSFTMPEAEYALIAAVKRRCVGNGLAVKKSEVLRAAIIAFAAQSDATVAAGLQALEVIKTGRPPQAQK